MSAFLCPKTKTSQEEPCSTCEDCPGDIAAVIHLATFLHLDPKLLTPEMEQDLNNDGWERL